MGYTHYWKFTQNPKDIEGGDIKFQNAVSLLKEGIKLLPKTIEYGDEEVSLKLCSGNGKDEPTITDTAVCFNGDAASGHDSESFYIALDYADDYSFNFCKTSREPYDVAVCLAILCFKKAFGNDFSYKSDGDIKAGEEGWELAKKIMKKLH